MKLLKHLRCLLCGFLLLSPSVNFAQNWLWVHDTTFVTEAGSAQNVAADGLGHLYCAADGTLFKHDITNGNILWQKPYGGPWSTTSAVTDYQGNVYLYYSGIWSSTWSYVLEKIDPTGTLVWSKTGTQLGSPGLITAWGIALDIFGHIYITGYFTSNGMIAGTDTLLNSYPGMMDYVIKYGHRRKHQVGQNH